MGAMALAAGSIYLAVDQYSKLLAEMDDQHDTVMKGMLTENEIANRGNSEQLENNIRVAMETGRMDQKRADFLRSLADSADEQFNMVKKNADEGYTGVNTGFIDPIEQMADAYNLASRFQNNAAREYAANILLNSGYTADALVAMGVKLDGGLKGFETLFEGATEDVAAKLKNFVGGAWGKKTDAKALAPHIDFSGSKFEIHQDFRNEDPERVMLMFRRDILKAAEHRRQSRTATAFGL